MTATPRTLRYGREPGARSPLRRPEFRFYFAGNLTSNIGTWINNVALSAYMRNLTHSSLWVGIATAALFVPVILFALPAGALADRVDRLKLLRRSQILMGGLATVLTVLVATHHGNRFAVVIISFGFGIGVAIAIPTMQALIPSMVPPEELSDAIGLNALTFNVARAVGPAIAAVTLLALGAGWAFGINAATYSVLIWALWKIGTAPFPRASNLAPGPISEGIVYAWRHLRTRAMLLSIVALGIALDPITTLSPQLAEGYGHHAGAAGWIVAFWGLGGAAMIVAGMRAIRFMTHHGLGWIGLIVLAVGMAALGASTSLVMAIPGCLLAGVGYISAAMAFTTTIQRDVPENLRGRVSALWTLAFLGPRAVVSIVDGWMGDRYGARLTTALFGSVALIAALFLRRVETSLGEPVPPPA